MRTILIALMLLASLAVAELPSDQIKYKAPAPVISLQNVDPTSAWSIALSNAPLVKQPRWHMDDIGYMTSETQTVAQEAGAGITSALRNFTQSVPEIPASVGNTTENMTEINDTLVWW